MTGRLNKHSDTDSGTDSDAHPGTGIMRAIGVSEWGGGC
jgi:hypothetical protein